VLDARQLESLQYGKPLRLLFAFRLEGRAISAGPVLVNLAHGFIGDFPQRTAIPGARASIRRVHRNTAEVQDTGYATHHVGAPAKPEQVDPITGNIVFHDSFVTVGDIPADTRSDCSARKLAGSLENTQGNSAFILLCSEAGIIEGNLRCGIDRAIGSYAGGPE